METKKGGSAILMILIVITAIGILAMSALKMNGLIGQLVIERGQYQQKKAALEALALYGIALGYSQFHDENKAAEPIVKQFAAWPPGHQHYHGLVTVTPEKKKWGIVAQLGQNNHITDTIIAQVSPTLDGWEVTKWESNIK